MQYPYGVFEGGGIKAIAYGRALDVFIEEYGNFKKVAGSSGGAITASLLALGMRPLEIIEEMNEVDFNSFVNKSTVPKQIWGLTKYYGIHSSVGFYRYLVKIFSRMIGENSESITFKELAQLGVGPELYVLATNASTKFTKIFSHEHTPDAYVIEAIRASMSIPFYFRPTHICGYEGIWVDGGLINNYPIKIFDKYLKDGEETIGFKLDTKYSQDILTHQKEPEPIKITNLISYIKRIISTMLMSRDNYFRNSNDWKRTIFIDTFDVGTTEFNLSKERKEKLLRNGELAVKRFISDNKQ